MPCFDTFGVNRILGLYPTLEPLNQRVDALKLAKVRWKTVSPLPLIAFKGSSQSSGGNLAQRDPSEQRRDDGQHHHPAVPRG